MANKELSNKSLIDTINELKSKLESSNSAFLNVVGKNKDGILIFDNTGTILYANKSALDLFDKDLGNLLGENIGIFIDKNHLTEITIPHKNGELVVAEVNVADTFWHNKPAKLASIRDISQHKHLEKLLKELSYFDFLTKLTNRIPFEEGIKKLMGRANRNDTKLALFYIDLDGFKGINDKYGHPIGDKLLIYVANVLKSAVRIEDIVARLGGDEFGLVIELNKPHHAEIIANRLLSKIKNPIQLSTATIEINFSIGISVYPDHSTCMEELIKKADSAMYKAKKLGGGRFCFYQN